MKLAASKHYKYLPVGVLIAAFMYYSSFTTPFIKNNENGYTLVLTPEEAQVFLQGRNSNGENLKNTANKEHPISVKKGDVDIVILNNKVYNRDEYEMEQLKKGVVKKVKKKNNYKWPAHLNASSGEALMKIDFTKYQQEDQEYLEERLGIMVARARKVAEACKGFDPNLDAHTGPSHLLWDLKHKPHIVWCPNYKVASTTWMINFLRLAHFNENNPTIPDNKRKRVQYSHAFGARHDVVYDYYPAPQTDTEKATILRKSLRVIFVRHPFTRLLSAYRDKMTKMHPGPVKFQFRKMQIKIISQYRPMDSPINSPFPTFQEFVQFVINDTERLHMAKEWRKAVKCWMPYWAQCSVCTTDYNVIVKLETMSLDEKFLIILSNLKELKKLKQNEWRHLKNASSTEVAEEFYRQITKTQMKILYDRYRFDFEAFGYGIEEYLAIAKDSQEVEQTVETKITDKKSDNATIQEDVNIGTTITSNIISTSYDNNDGRNDTDIEDLNLENNKNTKDNEEKKKLKNAKKAKKKKRKHKKNN